MKSMLAKSQTCGGNDLVASCADARVFTALLWVKHELPDSLANVECERSFSIIGNKEEQVNICIMNEMKSDVSFRRD